MSEGRPQTISLFGLLDIQDARQLAPWLSEAVGDMTRPVVVNLRRATFVDSMLLGALAHAAAQLRNQGRRLTIVVEPGGPVERLIEVAGLCAEFEMVTDPAGTAPGSTPGPAAVA